MQKRTIAFSVALAAILAGGLGSAALADRGRDGGHARMMMGMAEGPFGGPGFDFDAMDANKDGKITPEEFKASRAERMKTVDADGDGKISADELVAMQMKRAEERARAMSAEMMQALDVDGDGAVTVTELLAAPGPGLSGKMLHRLDTDGDGAVSKAELEAAKTRFEQMRAEGGMGGKHGRHGHGPGEGRGPAGMEGAPMMPPPEAPAN